MKLKMEKEYIRRRNFLKIIFGVTLILFLFETMGIAGTIESFNTVNTTHVVLYVISLVISMLLMPLINLFNELEGSK